MQLRFFTIPVHGGDEAATRMAATPPLAFGARVAGVESWRRPAGWSPLFPGVAP
ncbi:hypothetical protein [Azospirillum cavernae]|uniref:hypothetical protein n=1 Tax=Azospirillum cavernae TaxID=2320860 RepID=UPI0013146D0C|nr:hypothetical protein [Azospirillum cavernae]